MNEETQTITDDASDNYEAVAYLEKDKAERFSEFLKYSGIKDVNIVAEDSDGTYAVNTTHSDFEKAHNLFLVFSENELNDKSADEDSNDDDENSVNLYETQNDKYKDNLSSAITFFICGAAGLLIVLLNDLGVIKLVPKGSSSFIFSNIVLILVFVIFILIGVFSLKYSKKIKTSATKEEKDTKEMYEWLEKNVTTDEIEASYDNDIQEEMKYFSRIEYIKNLLAKEFPDTPETTVEAVGDKYLENNF